MEFLTSNARLEQANEVGLWQTLDNQLFLDKDNSIYLVPKYYKTDNYTIPNWIAWLGGGKAQFDVRPSHFHDFGCEYHALIKVLLSKEELEERHFLRVNKHNKRVCENIPVKYLKIVKKDKWFIDCFFKRMMKVANNIPSWRINLMRGGVFFNFGWLANYYNDFDMSKIYKEV